MILAFEPNDDVLLTAQVARGFRLGGINDPLNVGVCTADDLATFSGQPDFEDETVLNYELGAKTQLADGRVTFNAAVFFSDIDDLQVIADAGSCSSRIVLNAQAESIGAEVELFARPTAELGPGPVRHVGAGRDHARRDSTRPAQPIAGIRDGNRLPTSPEFQASASVTYSWPFSATLEGFANFTFQHVGSSFTQLADQEPGVGCVGCPGAPGFFPFGDPTISSFTFEPELPSYEIGNLRFGVKSDAWEAALFVNNVWDERAFLSLDRERGFRARVGYLTNMPRTYGVSLRDELLNLATHAVIPRVASMVDVPAQTSISLRGRLSFRPRFTPGPSFCLLRTSCADSRCSPALHQCRTCRYRRCSAAPLV